MLILILNIMTIAGQTSECPPSEVIPGCPCYNFEDGLFLECAGATEETLRKTMLGVLNEGGKIKEGLTSKSERNSLTSCK